MDDNATANTDSTADTAVVTEAVVAVDPQAAATVDTEAAAAVDTGAVASADNDAGTGGASATPVADSSNSSTPQPPPLETGGDSSLPVTSQEQSSEQPMEVDGDDEVTLFLYL